MSTNNPLNQKSDLMDERLQSKSQQAMKTIIGQLPDDTLSMSWRSALNERLVAEAAVRRKRQRLAWFLRPALGLGLAGALGMGVFGVLMLSQPHRSRANFQPAPVDSGLEAAMVNLHRQSTFAFDVGGVGLNPADAVNDPNAVMPKAATNWSEDDAESL